MNAVELRRVDPTRNMRRFYRYDVQPDLFGGAAMASNNRFAPPGSSGGYCVTVTVSLFDVITVPSERCFCT